MLQINDFWSNLSAEVLNFSGMSADMFAALLYAVVSIGNLHQGPNLFAVLALPFLSWWNEHLSTLTKKIASFSSFSHCLQRLDTSSRWARVALLICQHSNSDYVKASVMHPVKFKSSRIAITYQRVYYHPSGSSQAFNTYFRLQIEINEVRQFCTGRLAPGSPCTQCMSQCKH